MSGGAAVIEAVAAIAAAAAAGRLLAVVGATENLPSGPRGQARRHRHGRQRQDDRGQQHRRRGPAGARRLPLPCGRRGRRADRRPRDAHWRRDRRARLDLRGADEPTTTSWPRGLAAAERTGEIVWRLPLHEEYEELIKGTYGDLDNAPERARRARSSAAAFLSNFVGDTPWAHLDIAGSAWDLGRAYVGKGASGYGVRLLVELARSVLRAASDRVPRRSPSASPRPLARQLSSVPARAAPSRRASRSRATRRDHADRRRPGGAPPRPRSRRARPCRPRRRRLRVAAAQAHRHGLVEYSVDEQHGQLERHAQERVGHGVALGQALRRAAHQLAHRAAVPVAYAPLRSHTPASEIALRSETRGRPANAPGAPAGSPSRPAAHRARWPPAECPRTLTRVRSSDGSSPLEPVDRGGHVGERLRAAAAGADAPVLDVPHGPAAAHELGRDRPHHAPAVALAPGAAVDQHDHRMRPGRSAGADRPAGSDRPRSDAYARV